MDSHRLDLSPHWLHMGRYGGRRLTRRGLLFVAIPLVVALGLAAGLAAAHGATPTIGTGVVVIDTNLGYEDGAAAGTGLVLTRAGEVLTNNHVIQGATAIKVVVPGSGQSYSAHVVGYSISGDVAVIQASGASNLTTASIGNSSQVSVGDNVTAEGNAGGTGTLTTATGSITGLGKSIVASNDQGGSEQLVDLIETNAALEPGDSGGPLLNSAGQVVGMDTAASTGFRFQTVSATDSYAIPISRALTLASKIEAGNASSTVHVGATPLLGVEVQSVDSDPGASGLGYGYTPPVSSGALVAGVLTGGPADSAGLSVGDVITAVAGERVAKPDAITGILMSKAPGAKLSVTYVDQSGTSHRTSVTLASGPPQ